MKVLSREETLKIKLRALLEEHRRVDDAVAAMAERPAPESLELQRMKRRKLALKDEITAVQDQITPDIIA